VEGVTVVIKASIVVLTWNSTDLLRGCLLSLPQAITTCPYEVLVVDNGSRGYTPASLRFEFPWMQLLVNRDNRGVAPGRNQGIRVAQGEYIILLDDDTAVEPSAFDRLIAYMNTHPRVGLCAPKLTDLEGQLHLTCRFYPTLLDKLARQMPVAKVQQLRRETEMAEWDHSSIRAVDYVIGACQVIRREALMTVGLLDEKIFYGPEDVDFCLRLRQAGWQVIYNPEAVVIHKERRVARSLFSGLSWKHLWGISYYFWKHRYLFSRQRLYRRLEEVQPLHTPSPL
jgi:N-acetylglucosaminyl-diphospho-decaprenol L-rhamnosyltransferase